MSLADKISQLNLIRNHFRNIGDDTPHMISKLVDEVKLVDHYKDKFKYNSEFNRLSDLNKQLQHELEQYHVTSKRVKDVIAQVIHNKERSILQHDYMNYQKEDLDIELIDSRSQSLSKEIVNEIHARVQNYIDWRFAVIVMHPLDGQFVRNLVAGDPLYVVTQNETIKKRIKKRFNEFYRNNRLKIIARAERLNGRIASLCLAINVFEYMPLDEQANMLEIMFKKTYEGGTAIITFNDCEQRTSLELTLQGLRCYCTKELVLGKAFAIGWDIESVGSVNNGTWSYAILKRPGELTSIKCSAPIIENMKDPAKMPKTFKDPIGEKAHREAELQRRTAENLSLKAEGKIK